MKQSNSAEEESEDWRAARITDGKSVSCLSLWRETWQHMGELVPTGELWGRQAASGVSGAAGQPGTQAPAGPSRIRLQGAGLEKSRQVENVNIRKGGDFTPRKRDPLKAPWKVRTRVVFRRINMAAQQWTHKEGEPGPRSCHRRTLDFKIHIFFKL